MHLFETLTNTQANIVLESDEQGKSLYLHGICLQADVKNHNGRIYPLNEIKKAVDSVNKTIEGGMSILGELNHPSDLQINPERATHMITKMWVEGSNGFGKLKILPTPLGTLVKTLLESGVKLGVSSRGSGNVSEYDGKVSDFEMVTVDIVATPSAPNAYPTAIYEGILGMKHGHKIMELAAEANGDYRVQKYLKEEVLRVIKELKLK